MAGLVCLAAVAQAQCKPAMPGNCSDSDAMALATNLPDAPLPSDAASSRPATPAPHAAPAIGAVERAPKQRAISSTEDQVWRGLVVASHSAAAFDAWSTRNSLSQGHGYERNPLMRPFAGNGSIYAATQAAPVGLDFLSRYMLRRNNSLVRKLWWVPQTAFTAGSIWVGVRNVHVANAH